MKEDSIVYQKSFKFSKRIIKLYKYLIEEKKEKIISSQLLRAGTSIGANISEAIYAQSKKDFINKMSIALKEASESRYWIKLLEGDFITTKEADSLLYDIIELIKLLTTIVKSSKNNY